MLCRRLVQNCRYEISCFQKLFSTVQSVQLVYHKHVQEKFANVQNIEPFNEQAPETPTKRCPKHRKYVASVEIRNHLRDLNLEHLMDLIPKKIVRRSCRQHSALYLINYNVAKEFASMISKDLLKNACFVIECNPGLGFVTQRLLDAGVPSINLYEKCEPFLQSKSTLMKLYIKHRERIHIKTMNFFDIWMILLRDRINHDRFAEGFLIDAPCHEWKDKTSLQIIAQCPGRYLLSLLLHNFVKQTRLFELGRPVFFIAVPSINWKVDINIFTHSSIHFNQLTK